MRFVGEHAAHSGKRNFLYKMVEYGGRQGIMFVVSILLARLLPPSAYGQLAIMGIFITIAEVIVNSGFGKALVQYKEVDRNDYSAIFFITLIVCTCLYGVIFISAPAIESYYSFDDFVAPLRVMALILFIDTYFSIQNAIVQREMRFKALLLCNSVASVISGIIGISMAYLGVGVWALICQQLSIKLVACLLLGITIKWRPRGGFSFQIVKPLFSFGWKVLVEGLTGVLYNNIRALVIGKMYTSADLGYYDKGRNIPAQINNFIFNTIAVVMFPMLSVAQDNLEELTAIGRKIKRVALQLSFPALVGIYMTAPELVSLLLTDKWSASVPFMRIFCLYFLADQVCMINIQMQYAAGSSRAVMNTSVASKLIGLFLLVGAVFFFDSPIYIALSELLAAIPWLIINAYYTKAIIRYGYRQQLRDLATPLGLSGAVVVMCQIIGLAPLSIAVMLCLKIFVSVVVYCIVSIIFKTEIVSLLPRLKPKS